jgi:hypothetical protein
MHTHVTKVRRALACHRALLPHGVGWRALAWSLVTCGLTAAISVILFACLLRVATGIHDDIGPQLGPRLELLAHDPKLVFAGDSRTQEQVDPVLVAKLLAKPTGYAINIAAPGEDPISVLAAVRQHLHQFRDIDLIINLSPYNVNDGIKKEYFFPSTVIARLGLAQQVRTFVPSHIDTLVWFIQEAFLLSTYRNGFPRLSPERVARLGFEPLPGRITTDGPVAGDHRRYRDFLGSEVGPFEGHPYYRDWQPSGIKARSVRKALCELRPLVKRLAVILPPWAPIESMIESVAWQHRDSEFERIVAAMASECRFDFLPIAQVDSLMIEHFSDETHVNDVGAAIYTSYLLERLGYRPVDDAS